MVNFYMVLLLNFVKRKKKKKKKKKKKEKKKEKKIESYTAFYILI